MAMHINSCIMYGVFKLPIEKKKNPSFKALITLLITLHCITQAGTTWFSASTLFSASPLDDCLSCLSLSWAFLHILSGNLAGDILGEVPRLCATCVHCRLIYVLGLKLKDSMNLKFSPLCTADKFGFEALPKSWSVCTVQFAACVLFGVL